MQVRKWRHGEATSPAQGPQRSEAAQGPQAGLHPDPELWGETEGASSTPRQVRQHQEKAPTGVISDNNAY